MQNDSNYFLYGLSWSIPFSCPELLPETKPTDVLVELGKVDEKPFIWDVHGACYKAAPRRCFLSVPGIAKYLVLEGGRIIIEPEKESDIDAIKLFLYKTVAGALLIQRGIIPFSGSAVERDGKAILLLGSCAAGKSIVAAGLIQRGFTLISDHICAVHFDKKPIVRGGYPFLMLWEKAMEELGHDPSNHQKVRQGMRQYRLPVSRESFRKEVEVEAIYVLRHQRSEKWETSRISGYESFNTLHNVFHHSPLLNGMKKKQEGFKLISNILKSMSINQIKRYGDIHKLPEFIDNLVIHLDKSGEAL